MLYTVRFLCFVVTTFARLVHIPRKALAPMCSPMSMAATAGLPPPQLSWRKAHPVVVTDKTKELAAPSAVLAACNGVVERVDQGKKTVLAARRRPGRLVIPVSGSGADASDAAGGWVVEEEVVEEVVEGEGFCMASRSGVRHAMEDGYGVTTHKIGEDSQMAFYGVYDGHGGRAAVDLVSSRLGDNIVAALVAEMETQRLLQQEEASQHQHLDVMALMRDAYLTADSDFLRQGVRGGACAATALVKDGELYVANLGDCRAVMSTDGVATPLTTDHTAARDDERVRIESNGGYVSCNNGVWRVQDSLAVSRAFGDVSLKEWVIAEPEIKKLRLTPGCEFLVIASDGLWNKVSNQEAVDVVVRSNAKSVVSCKELVDMARRRGSRDDITVMVVDLQRFQQ